MAKQILRGSEVREKLLQGIKVLAETVTTTLGPRGRNVGLDKTFVKPRVVHDGVTVANDISLPNPFENFGAQLVKQAASKTNDRAGDGTTTSTLLAWEMIQMGMEAIDTFNANPMRLKKGMSEAVQEVVAAIDEMSENISDNNLIKQVATISAQDAKIGGVIAEAISKVGRDGVMTVEESAKVEIDYEFKEGMEFDRGYISPQFAYDQEGNAELENPLILLLDSSVTAASDMAAALKKIVDETKRQEIVIIADNIEGAALYTLLVNKERGGIRPLGIQAPGFAETRKEILEDIAVLTGATVVSKEKGMEISEVDSEWLGKADRVISNDSTTKIVGGFGESKDIESRAKLIKAQIKDSESEFEKKRLKERLARLVSGAAIIKVGALTEVELNEKRERVIDAVEATKSALAEGVVPGGGITLRNIYHQLASKIRKEDAEDEDSGYAIVVMSLLAPFRKLMENAGISDDDIDTEKLNNNPKLGIDVNSEQLVNLRENGIIDPTKVVKNSILNATSVATLILTTEAVICDLEEKDGPAPQTGGLRQEAE